MRNKLQGTNDGPIVTSIPGIRRTSRPLLWLILTVVLLFILASITPWSLFLQLVSRLNLFATVFLGIFIEAMPYLLFGTLVSGLVEVFLDRDLMARVISKRSVPAAISGALMGLVFPVCECGVIPLARRLFHKGLPLPAGIAFLLAAPVFNPIVIFSTAAAFGWGPMLLWRVGLSLLIAVVVGLIFSIEKDPTNVLRPVLLPSHEHEHTHHHEATSFGDKIQQALLICADEFFEMGRYLIVGAMLAAGLQTFIPQSSLLAIGSGPILSVIVMMVLAIILSICSTVDAFVALGFVGAFSFGSLLSFLVFGPMVDIKSTLMYLQVFRRKPVAYLVLIPFLISLLAGIAFNYFVP
ncbi:MAG TPA: permease [Anaerolineales bacterium]|nr:permease [Anaerolineales bacterium]